MCCCEELGRCIAACRSALLYSIALFPLPPRNELCVHDVHKRNGFDARLEPQSATLPLPTPIEPGLKAEGIPSAGSIFTRGRVVPHCLFAAPAAFPDPFRAPARLLRHPR